MRAVIQRVKNANVIVNGEVIGNIDKGILVFLGVGNEDKLNDIDYMVEKIVNLRIFEDEEEKMNLSILDVNGELLVVSQFTLYGDVRKGRRPNFTEAAKPEIAEEMYNKFLEKCREYNLKVETGSFGADMKVNIINDGPVTILLDSNKVF